MKKILLLLVMISFITVAMAQKRKKAEQPLTGYAITAIEKGGRSWKEVRLVNITTGEEIKSIYQSTKEVEALNARTGNPVVKKDATAVKAPVKKVVNLDQELAAAQGNTVRVRTVIVKGSQISYDKPFATNSAAMAYDKKHERLYYTPMGINQLRYIDLKSGKIYYFENEAFGVVTGSGDGANQITRMVIASDGNGYALTNDANHLIRFTTGKEPVITDLGALSDDAANEATFSVHNRRGHGGDMVADASGNLYLLTANRNVFKIAINTKVATHMGVIKGLPDGFSTNGAMVEDGSKVIVASSESAVGYYRFDLATLQAEKVSTSPSVFNASDLANDKLAFAKKKKERKNETPEEQKQQVVEEVSKKAPTQDILTNNGIAVYPNPVTNKVVKISFADQPTGKYEVQLIDIAGRLIKSQEITIGSNMQIQEFRLPQAITKGSYLLKVSGVANKVSVTNKLIVQ